MAQLKSTSITGSLKLASTTSETSSIGYLWYNNSTYKLQYSYYGAVWTSGNALNAAIYCQAGSGQSSTAASFGGYSCSSFSSVACTEQYNGTSWATGGAMICARHSLAAAGTSANTSLAFGGFNSPSFSCLSCTEAYNGTSWSSGGGMNIGRCLLAGGGMDISAIAITGCTPSGMSNSTETYNGFSWSQTSGTSVCRTAGAATATSCTNALIFGGMDSSFSTISCTESWNGSSWSTVSPLINTRCSHAAGGIPTSTITFGGYNPTTYCIINSEQYNGTTWYSASPLITPRYNHAGAGACSNSAIAFGGYSNIPLSCSEVYSSGLQTCSFTGVITPPPYAGV
jgi:hypothetical protein